MADSICHTPSIFFMTLQNEILSTETSDFVKQMIILKLFIFRVIRKDLFLERFLSPGTQKEDHNCYSCLPLKI